MHVVAERLERRNIKDVDAVGQFAQARFADQAVQGGQKCGQRFARSGGRGDQHVLAGLNFRPAQALRLGNAAEPRREPVLDQRIERLVTSPFFQYPKFLNPVSFDSAYLARLRDGDEETERHFVAHFTNTIRLSSALSPAILGTD